LAGTIAIASPFHQALICLHKLSTITIAEKTIKANR
jgi:hypothetical protein